MWRRPRLVTADTRRRGRGRADAPGCVEPSHRSRQAMPAMEADPGRQRHGGAPRGGLPVAREGPRLASVASRLTSATYSRLAPVGAPPSPRGWLQDEGSIPGAPQAPREGDEWLEGVVAGTSGTGLFDIVNRGSAHRAGCVLSAGATHRHALSPPLEQHTRLSSPRRRGPSIPAVRVYGTMGPRFRGDDSS